MIELHKLDNPLGNQSRTFVRHLPDRGAKLLIWAQTCLASVNF